MKVNEWLGRLVKKRGLPSEDELLLARQVVGSLTDLENSAGWATLRDYMLLEAHTCMTELCDAIPERQRDYLASRINTIDWFLKLPRQKLDWYGNMLSEEPDDPTTSVPSDADYLCPTPRMDEDD